MTINWQNNNYLNNIIQQELKYINPCENCPNNPMKNGLSTVCNCALPSLSNPIT